MEQVVKGIMYKACSRCGKIHDSRYKCNVGKVYQGGDERKLRARYVWARKSLEIREKANYLCEVCRDKGVYTFNALEVHHIDKVKDQPEKLLDNYNLICLCVDHHKEADSGKLDKEYLRQLAVRREDGNSPMGFCSEFSDNSKTDRKSTRLNSSHPTTSRMPSSA